MTTITVLSENTARGMGILGEHGLAWWIDTGVNRVLFDTGQGLVLKTNAQRLGVDLRTADAIILSHGHLDHVGGLETVLGAAPEACLYLHPRAIEPKFTGSDGKPCGRRLSSAYMETESFRTSGRRVILTRDSQEVVPGVWTTGEIPRTNDFEDTGGPFFLDEAMTAPDPLLDDQAVYFAGREGLVVVLGCAHAGVVNTLRRIEDLTKGAPIDTVVGGMHLERADKRRLSETVAELRKLGVRRFGANHCTGIAAITQLRQEFPGHCVQCAAGTRWVF